MRQNQHDDNSFGKINMTSTGPTKQTWHELIRQNRHEKHRYNKTDTTRTDLTKPTWLKRIRQNMTNDTSEEKMHIHRHIIINRKKS